MVTADFLVIGGGIVGLSIARELKHAHPDSAVVLIEKEQDCGFHASGRNSGVLHAGFYYSPDSLKAKFTRAGNALLTAYCESRDIALNRCGKLVVAQSRADHAALDELQRRGHRNGITLQPVTEREAKEIEPRVKTCERALFSPSTSTVHPGAVVARMKKDALDDGVQIHCGVRYRHRQGPSIVTSTETYQAGYVVNAAGLYADRIARDFGFSERYRILPFKGLYLYSDEPAGAVRTNVYPVPDLRNPFLSVHFTVTADGHVKIGPTALPALWREHYRGSDNFTWSEFMEILVRTFGLLVAANFAFKRLAANEVAKCSRARMVAQAGALLEGVRVADYRRWGPPGIRAQLLDIKQRKLEMDFLLEGDDRSLHVLNAVSPGFTCALPFAQHVTQLISALTH